MHQKKVFFRVIGIMSGTSLDGIDLALIKFNIKTWDFKILKSKLIPYNKYWISELSDIHFKSKNELLKIDLLYTKFLGEKINEFITENKLQNIDMVCSHGHTAIHNPDMGITYQLGNLSTLNSKYRIMTVCDFRIQDVALGGQGAPLVPVGDSILFSNYSACLNLGGFANISRNNNKNIIAYDLCSVNIVLNYLSNKTGKKFDTRSPLEIYKDLKKKDDKITIAFHPSFYIDKNLDFLSLSGISHSETIYCNESGYISTYLSDRYGFNNPDADWDKKEIEYLLVGDSFTHGACVNRPNDIGSVLRTLSNKSVINLGYGGNGPLIQYATLREYLKPGIKNILWLYFEGNDLIDLKSEIKTDLLMQYLKASNFKQNLKMNQAKIDEINTSRISKSFFDTNFRLIKKDAQIKYKILKFIRLDKTKKIIIQYLGNQKIKNEKPFKEFNKIIKKTNDLAIANNSKLYFVFLPDFQRYKFKKIKNENKIIKEFLQKLDINYIDIDKEVFQNEDNKLGLFPFEFEAHYTIEGYYKVATSIHEIVSNK